MEIEIDRERIVGKSVGQVVGAIQSPWYERYSSGKGMFYPLGLD
jgi:hypothetical protein